MTELQTVRLPMLCVCGDPDQKAARKAEMDAMRAEVMERISKGSEEMRALSVTDANFLDSVVWSLDLDYGAAIEGIMVDQWSGVVAERWKDKQRVYVECDRVEDGIAAIWKAFADGLVPGPIEPK